MLVFWVSLFLVGAFVLNALYKRTNAYQNQFVDIKKFETINDDDRFDIVNLGSNQPKFAFDYSDVNISGMNWAVGPQTFEYDFAILKKFAKHLNPNAKIIIPICPLSFFLLETPRNHQVKYYRLFTRSEMPDYDIWHKFTEYTLPLLFHPLRFVNLLRDKQLDNRLDIISNKMDSDQIRKDASYWIEDCWNPQFNIDIAAMQPLSEKNCRSIEGNVHILSNIIKYCIDRNFEPLLVLLPSTTELSSKFSDEFIKNYILKYVIESNKFDVPILNFHNDERFSSSKLYINSFFMNKVGRKRFTKEFIKHITIE